MHQIPRGGARIGAGRKPHLEDMQAREIVQASVRICLLALNAPNSEVPFEVKLEVARHFVLKAMPQRVEGEGFENHSHMTMIIPSMKELPEEIQSRINELNQNGK